MGIFLAFFVVVSLVCLILLVKIKLKQRRSQVRAVMGIHQMLTVSFSCFGLKCAHNFWKCRVLTYNSHFGGSVVSSMCVGLWKNLEISLKEVYIDP